MSDQAANEQVQQAPVTADGPDKEFAEWLGRAVQGAEKVADATLNWFVEQLKQHQQLHGQLSQRIAQGQQELANARTELSKLEGRIEQGVAAAKRLKDVASGGAEAR